MGETAAYAQPGNTIEPVFACTLPFTFDEAENETVYVNDPPGGDGDPPSPFSDIMLLQGNLITLYSAPSEFIDSYRTDFAQQPAAANTVTEVGDASYTYFTYVQPDGAGGQLADYFIVSDIPEPQSLWLLAGGLVFSAIARRRPPAVSSSRRQLSVAEAFRQ